MNTAPDLVGRLCVWKAAADIQPGDITINVLEHYESTVESVVPYGDGRTWICRDWLDGKTRGQAYPDTYPICVLLPIPGPEKGGGGNTEHAVDEQPAPSAGTASGPAPLPAPRTAHQLRRHLHEQHRIDFSGLAWAEMVTLHATDHSLDHSHDENTPSVDVLPALTGRGLLDHLEDCHVVPAGRLSDDLAATVHHRYHETHSWRHTHERSGS